MSTTYKVRDRGAPSGGSSSDDDPQSQEGGGGGRRTSFFGGLRRASLRKQGSPARRAPSRRSLTALASGPERSPMVPQGGDDLRRQQRVYLSHSYALGLQRPPQWTDDSNLTYYSGAMTDRTHGMKGRSVASKNLHKARARERRRSLDKKEMESINQEALNGGGGGANNTQSQTFLKRAGGKYGPYTPMANLELTADPLEPASLYELPNFSGRWKCASTSGEWEVFLRLAGLPEEQIKLAAGAKFGAGLAVQEIEMNRTRNRIKITNMGVQMRGFAHSVGATVYTPKESSELNIDGTPQQTSTTAALGVSTTGSFTLAWEARSLVTRYQMKTRQGEVIDCIMKRSLQDGFMLLKIILADFYVLRVYALLDKDGDYILGAPNVTRAGTTASTEGGGGSVVQRTASQVSGTKEKQKAAGSSGDAPESSSTPYANGAGANGAGLTGSATTMGARRQHGKSKHPEGSSVLDIDAQSNPPPRRGRGRSRRISELRPEHLDSEELRAAQARMGPSDGGLQSQGRPQPPERKKSAFFSRSGSPSKGTKSGRSARFNLDA